MSRGGFLILLGVYVVLTAGCGKYGKPLPPEVLAPAAVQSLEIRTEIEGVTFRWRSPDNDVRGEKLKSIDEYRVYRREIASGDALLKIGATYTLLTTIPDTHLSEKKRLQDEARAAGKIGRKISVDESLSQFEFSDRSLRPGTTYLYRITPVNQGGTEGGGMMLVKVLFRGDTSLVEEVDASELSQDGDEESFD